MSLHGNVIDSFSGENRFLSNFQLCSVTMDEEWYGSTEHAYQAAKTLDLNKRKIFRGSTSCGTAKRLGQTLVLRPDWEEVKIPVMKGLLDQKFCIPILRACLMETGDATLIEGNGWNDTFWGVCKGKGHNHLGILLMQVRDEIRNMDG